MGWLGDARDDKAMERISAAMRFTPYGGTVSFLSVDNLEDVAWNIEQLNEYLTNYVVPEVEKTKRERDEMRDEIAAFGRLMKRAGVAMTPKVGTEAM
jgi:hypothetical protein